MKKIFAYPTFRVIYLVFIEWFDVGDVSLMDLTSYLLFVNIFLTDVFDVFRQTY
ncbi:MAG: hypothetical protein NC206_03900 [Bacteroides sp.]|nr:hypothetical protein [Bacteroides sp.]